MKYVKNAKRVKTAAAALVFGMAFTSTAHAKIGPKEGMSLADLQRLVQDFSISQDGRKLVLKGLVPQRCVAGAKIEKMGIQGGKHVVMVRMPSCEVGPGSELKDTDELVELQRYLAPQELSDVDGQVALRSYKADKHIGTNERNQDEILEKIKIVSSAKLEEEARKAEEAERKRKIEDLQKRVGNYCKAGDMASVSRELEGARDLLGDISDLLEKAQAGQRDKFKKQLADARNSAEAKEAMERYREAAGEYGWDADALNTAYVEKRFQILNRLVEDLKVDKELKVSSVAKELESWRREMREMDRDTYRKRLRDVAMIYVDLGLHEQSNSNHTAADSYFVRAKQFTNREDALKIEGLQMKPAVDAYKACLKKNPTKMAECEKKFADKAKAHADKILEALKASAERSDDGMEEYQTFAEQYIQTFGQGPSYYYMGYGRSNPWAPGALELYKREALQNYQMQMYQRMMSGQGNMGRGPLF